MQSQIVDYTELVCWNAKKLESNEVAISSLLADKYKLSVGDKIYSKHIVYGNTQEYIIVQVLPGLSNYRLDQKSLNNDGIIIIGEDSAYVNNISSDFII